MCTNAPLGRAWLQPGRRVCTSRCRRPPGAQPLSPPPSRREGDRLASGGAADGGLLRRKPPAPGCVLPTTAGNVPSPLEWQWPDLWGIVGGAQHPGPSRSRAAPQGPQISTRRKKGPVGVGAQDKKRLAWPWAPWQGDSAGVPDPSPTGACPWGSPFPGSSMRPPSPPRPPQREPGGRGTPGWGYPERGAWLLSRTLNLTSDPDSPKKHGLTPVAWVRTPQLRPGNPISRG